MRLFRLGGVRLKRSERNYVFGLATVLLLFCGGYVSFQLWLNYSADLKRAVAWLGGAQDLGTSKLQKPILREASFPRIAVQQRSMSAAIDQAVKGLDLASLPLAGQSVAVQFAGVGLPSNSELANYLLLQVKQELQRAQAERVLIRYPETTFRLGSSTATDGYAAELDNVIMPIRDSELVNAEYAADFSTLLLRIREAGVDTEDRSIYSQDFYIRVALFASGLIFIVGVLAFLVIDRRWPGNSRRTGVISSLLALAFGWNTVMFMFISLRPDQKRFNVINRVDLRAFVRLGDVAYDLSVQGRHEKLLGVDQYNQPAVLGSPKVMAPSEAGVYQLIPPTQFLP